jgi:hypothetical protein
MFGIWLFITWLCQIIAASIILYKLSRWLVQVRNSLWSSRH